MASIRRARGRAVPVGVWVALSMAFVSACSGGAAADVTSPAFSTETTAPETTAPVPETTVASPATTAPPPVAANPDVVVGPGTSEIVLDVDGVPRRYRLHIPEGLAGAAALVIDLHGFTADPANQDALSGWSRLADTEKLVVAQPAALGDLPAWETAPGSPGAERDIALVRAVVADVSSRVELDPDRVYASGFSNGGGMAHRLACDASDLFAAIGTVAGTYLQIDTCATARPVPVISFHGTADLIVPIQGMSDVLPDVRSWAESWAGRNQCAPVPEVETPVSDAVRSRWLECAEDAEVALYVIDGGRHTWPGSRSPGLFQATETIDATAVMWSFFASHPMP